LPDVKPDVFIALYKQPHFLYSFILLSNTYKLINAIG